MKGCGKLHCCLILSNYTATPTFSKHYPDQSGANNTEARPFTRKKIMAC